MTPELLNAYPEGITIDELMGNKELFRKIIYTEPTLAVQELKRRQENHTFDNLHENLPGFKKDSLCAVMWGAVATPNLQTFHFIEETKKLGLKACFLEYKVDKFTSNNPSKRFLGKMGFFSHVGKKGGQKIDWMRVIDPNKSNGHLISKVRTQWGQKLHEFHHEIFNLVFPGLKKNIFDVSHYLRTNGPKPELYYKHMMVFFLKQAIEFENFYLDGTEDSFLKQNILPAFFGVWKEYGLKPLIIPIEPFNEEGSDYWFSYPQVLKDKVFQKINTHSTNPLKRIYAKIKLWI